MSIEQAAYVARIRSELAQARGELAQAQDELAVIGKLAQVKQWRLHECAYCGYQYLLGSKLTEHIESCPEHPLAKVKTELAQARAELDHIYMVATRRNIELTQALNERDEAEAELDRMRQAAQNQSAEVQELWLSPSEAEGLKRQLADARRVARLWFRRAREAEKYEGYVNDCRFVLTSVRKALDECQVEGKYDAPAVMRIFWLKERAERAEAQTTPANERMRKQLALARLQTHQAGQRTENLQQEKVSVHEALDECQIPRSYDDGKPASARTRIFWLNRRAERAEALAALVTPELANLLAWLAIDIEILREHFIDTFDNDDQRDAKVRIARDLAAKIREALDDC